MIKMNARIAIISDFDSITGLVENYRKEGFINNWPENEIKRRLEDPWEDVLV